jgi:hypothetical protein
VMEDGDRDGFPTCWPKPWPWACRWSPRRSPASRMIDDGVHGMLVDGSPECAGRGHRTAADRAAAACAAGERRARALCERFDSRQTTAALRDLFLRQLRASEQPRRRPPRARPPRERRCPVAGRSEARTDAPVFRSPWEPRRRGAAGPFPRRTAASASPPSSMPTSAGPKSWPA